MRFALSFNIIHTPPHEEADANHQATCISERDVSTICVCVRFKWCPSPPSNNFCNKASHAAKDISNRALNDDDNEQTDRSAREKKEEKGKT